MFLTLLLIAQLNVSTLGSLQFLRRQRSPDLASVTGLLVLSVPLQLNCAQ